MQYIAYMCYEGGVRTRADKTSRIGEIVEVMQNTWDLPADCNEGELFTYAETLYDRIEAGDGKDALYAYLSGVQVSQLEMAQSDDFRRIVDRAVELRSTLRKQQTGPPTLRIRASSGCRTACTDPLLAGRLVHERRPDVLKLQTAG